MEKRYCVRLIRCDGAIIDVINYYYWDLEDVKEHFNRGDFDEQV